MTDLKGNLTWTRFIKWAELRRTEAVDDLVSSNNHDESNRLRGQIQMLDEITNTRDEEKIAEEIESANPDVDY